MTLHGVALVDKPAGMSSFSVVSRLRRLFRAQGVSKAGHTGTLDPLATGLLPICIGESTKFAQRLLDANKGYLATVKLGRATTTGDTEGEVLSEAAVPVVNLDAIVIDAAMTAFRGVIEQTPPQFSALKINGKAAYEYAREGKRVEIAARQVEIFSLQCLSVRPSERELDIAVVCSKGTYVRTLAEDLAQALGTVGHLSALRRTLTGGFSLAKARTLEEWMDADEAVRCAWLLPTDVLVAELAVLQLNALDSKAIRNGKVLPCKKLVEKTGQLFRLYDEERGFFGLGTIDMRGNLRAERLLATNSIRGEDGGVVSTLAHDDV